MLLAKFTQSRNGEARRGNRESDSKDIAPLLN